MASGKYRDKGWGYLFWFGLICTIGSGFFVFIAFATPYWYKSWSRVHSPLSMVGLWQICLAGWVKPREPSMRSYVGCWWIHSTFFQDVYDDIMPPWFRGVQALVTLTLICNIVVAFFMVLYVIQLIIDKTFIRRHVIVLISSLGLLIAGFLVLIVSFVFAFKSKDPDWMPRPWLNYLSWSFGFNVVGGFFAFFGGVALFIKYTEIYTKPEPSMSRDREMVKPPPQYPPPEDYGAEHYPPPPPSSETGTTSKVGESFV